MKKYKAGQLITINGHVYRVKKPNKNGSCRNYCAFKYRYCSYIFPSCPDKIGTNYLEKVCITIKN